jgi:outer membrane receptor protein involved in Fe transport
VDIEASYLLPLEELFAGNPGSLQVRLLAGYLAENQISSPLLTVSFNDAGNNTASLPHWRGNLLLNYDRGTFSAFTQARYIGAMTWDKSRALGLDTDFNHIDPQVYVDAQLSLRVRDFGHEQSIFLNVQNVLDKQPPYAPRVGGATPLPTDPNLFDQVGRMFRVGVRLEFGWFRCSAGPASTDWHGDLKGGELLSRCQTGYPAQMDGPFRVVDRLCLPDA